MQQSAKPERAPQISLRKRSKNCGCRAKPRPHYTKGCPRDIPFPAAAALSIDTVCRTPDHESSKTQAQTRDEGAVAREFGVQVEWIETIIRVEQVEQIKPDLRMAAGESVARRDVVLPDIFVRQVGIVLVIPG